MDSSQGREAHSVSLKVLRLSRPSLSESFSAGGSHGRSTVKSIHAIDEDHHNVSAPALKLPSTFGTAYVGEPFFCTLCANNELNEGAERQVSNVKLAADMQSPSGTIALDLLPDDSTSSTLMPRQPLQKNVRFDLREEGSHTLAVNVSYSETTMSKDQAASSGRVRSFRKLYQFVARPCLNVRTKVSTYVPQANGASTFALEAQIDNLADDSIVLKTVTFNPKAAFKSTSLNWDTFPLKDEEYSNCPIMAPRDVQQVAFVVRENTEGAAKKELTRDGRTLLGQLGLRWRSQMGEEGYLTTGMLATKKA